MGSDQANEHYERELKHLEKSVDELVGVCAQLRRENQSLRQRQAKLMAERASLLHKDKQVRGRVEAMIDRLKAMEEST